MDSCEHYWARIVYWADIFPSRFHKDPLEEMGIFPNGFLRDPLAKITHFYRRVS
jgi:hypothetical protein